MTITFSTGLAWAPLALPFVVPVPMFEIRAAATSAPRINSIAVKQISGPSGALGIGIARDTLTGTILNAYPLGPEDPTVVSNVQHGLTVSTLWSKVPTTPASYLRRFSFRGGGGGNPGLVEAVLRFQRGLTFIGASGSIVIWITGAAANIVATELTHIEVDD